MPRTALPALDTSGSTSAECEVTDSNLPIERDELLTRCMGSSALAQRLVASFIARVQDEAPELQRLLEAGQIEALARKAHQLRGSAANISAPKLTSIFDSLERLANQNQLAG